MKKSTKNGKEPPKKETWKSVNKQCLDLWSDCVIARDRVCRHSGDDYGLSAHHIRSVTHKATRFDLENGICLSWRKIHFLQHANPERFHDAIIDLIGQQKYDELKAKSARIYKPTIQDLRDTREFLKRKLKEYQSDYGR